MRRYIPENVKLIPEGAERKFRGEIFEVWQWPQEMFDGSVETFEMLRREDTVVVIAILTAEEAARLRGGSFMTEENGAEARQSREVENARGGDARAEDRVVIAYQAQPRQAWFYAYPGGRHDHPEEDELAAAKRELREETGLSFADWKLVDVRQPFTKIDWLTYTFVATGLVERGEQKLDAGEKIEVLEATFDELRKHAAKPNAKYLIPEFMRGMRSLDELRELPAMFEY